MVTWCALPQSATRVPTSDYTCYPWKTFKPRLHPKAASVSPPLLAGAAPLIGSTIRGLGFRRRVASPVEGRWTGTMGRSKPRVEFAGW